MQAKHDGFLIAMAILLVLIAIEEVLKSFGQQGPTTLTPILFWRRTMGDPALSLKIWRRRMLGRRRQ